MQNNLLHNNEKTYLREQNRLHTSARLGMPSTKGICSYYVCKVLISVFVENIYVGSFKLVSYKSMVDFEESVKIIFF